MGRSGISDYGLRACKNIKKLYAKNNSKITTCDPFAKSLKILYAENECGISDDGLQLCDNIQELHASGNNKIVHAIQLVNSRMNRNT